METENNENSLNIIIEICKSNKNGISDDELTRNLPSITQEKKLELINQLIHKGDIKVVSKNGKIFYYFQDEKEYNKVK